MISAIATKPYYMSSATSSDAAAPEIAATAQSVDAYQETKADSGFIEKLIGGVSNFIRQNITGGGTIGEFMKSDFQTKAVVCSTLLGGATGTFVGYEAALQEEVRATKSHNVWQEPVMYQKYVGDKPSNYYSWGTFGQFEGNDLRYDGGKLIGADHGIEKVFSSAPVMRTNGTPEMKTVEADIYSKRFGRTTGAFGGFLLGAFGGFLIGTASAIIHSLVMAK